MKNHIDRFVASLSDRRSLRIVVVGILIALAAVFVASRIASASAPMKRVGPLQSPITSPITLTLDCDDGWNPSCHPTASTTSGGTLRTYFYIDGRFRGPANTVYTNVCTLFRLRDGFHTAKLYARDSRGFSARIGPYSIIQCDRTPPYVTTGLFYRRGIANLAPFASDRWSGVATKTLTVDGTDQTWEAYSDVCLRLSLSTGWHSAVATATDEVGNTRSSARNFRCR